MTFTHPSFFSFLLNKIFFYIFFLFVLNKWLYFYRIHNKLFIIWCSFSTNAREWVRVVSRVYSSVDQLFFCSSREGCLTINTTLTSPVSISSRLIPCFYLLVCTCVPTHKHAHALLQILLPILSSDTETILWWDSILTMQRGRDTRDLSLESPV